jgi:hypothetical protein
MHISVNATFQVPCKLRGALDTIIRKRKRTGKNEYLVSFDGYSDKYNQWIPEKHIINVLDNVGKP